MLIPCLNEERTVSGVVAGFRQALPEAEIHVFDNNSTDATADRARSAGAIVTFSPRPGKGAVVRHMFRKVDADVYVMVDGDETYPAQAAGPLIETFHESDADMLVGSRLETHAQGAFRILHRFGNSLFSILINRLFGVQLSDVLSGYRVFSREFVKLVPLSADGFEIETELTLAAIGNGFQIRERPIAYGTRPEGSESKLNTFTDGAIILRAIVNLFRRYKPLVFFAYTSLFTGILALGAGTLPILDYVRYRYVFHLPLAVLAAGLGLLSAAMFGIGLLLDNQAQYNRSQIRALRAILAEIKSSQ